MCYDYPFIHKAITRVQGVIRFVPDLMSSLAYALHVDRGKMSHPIENFRPMLFDSNNQHLRDRFRHDVCFEVGSGGVENFKRRMIW